MSAPKSLPSSDQSRSYVIGPREKIAAVQQDADETKKIMGKLIPIKVEKIVQESGVEKNIEDLVAKTDSLAGSSAFSTRIQAKPPVTYGDRLANFFKKLNECLCCCCSRTER